MTVVVVKPGLQSTLQSRPRAGLRHQGVPSGGAADPLSLALANRLVGNAWDASAVESTLLGPTLKFATDIAFALVGGTAATTLNGDPVEPHRTLVAGKDDVLDIGPVGTGARVYLAVAGGFVADDILGATSTNLQAGFGGHEGRALRTGDRLATMAQAIEYLETPTEFRPPVSTSWVLRACVGAEGGLLDDVSRDALFDSNWRIDRRADRMGLRLEGPPLRIASDGRMPSAGVVPGTIQCPEDGAPYVLSVDAGTVGGYPRIGQVARVDRHLLGQLRPGDHVRLVHREPEQAVAEYRAKLDYWREWLPDIAAVI